MIPFVQALDAHVLQTLVAMRDPAMTVFMANVSLFGEWTVLLPLTLLVAAGLTILRQRGEAMTLALAVFGSTAVVLAMKHFFERPRPDVMYRAIGEIGYSFPSAHAALSLAFYGTLCYIALRTVRSRYTEWILVGFTTIVVMLIGFSRLYLGVHYLSDVAVGYAIGTSFILGGEMARRALKSRAAF